MKTIDALSLALALAVPVPVLGAEIVVTAEALVPPAECTGVTVEDTCLER